MKCICGYQSFPNNARILANHVQDCMVDGPCKDLKPLPTVVWRDGGFSVVRETEEGEQTYEIGLVRYETEVEEEVLKTTPASEEDPN
jgi:hypothetical protein